MKKRKNLTKVVDELLKKDKEHFFLKQSEKKVKEEPLEKKVKTKTKKIQVKSKAKKTKVKGSDVYLKQGQAGYQQMFGKKLNYSKLFSYLGSGKDGYSTYSKELETVSSTKSTNDALSSENVDYVMQRKMWSVMLGGIPDYVDSDTEEKYRNWKTFDKATWWWKIRDLNNTFGWRDTGSNKELYDV